MRIRFIGTLDSVTAQTANKGHVVSAIQSDTKFVRSPRRRSALTRATAPFGAFGVCGQTEGRAYLRRSSVWVNSHLSSFMCRGLRRIDSVSAVSGGGASTREQGA